jgi:bifunctional DNA-binding transcriptional regulator/antitoxin component of YhaV-PrlF toxin-antitoxin module
MEMAMVQMDDKNRVLIPKKVREHLGLNKREVFLIYTMENVVYMRRAGKIGGPVLENIEGLGLTALAPSKEPRHSRELVIWALARRPVMSFRQLRSFLKKQRGNMSCQGTWKLLRELLADGQIKKLAQNEYVINPEWIKSIKKFCEVVEQRQRAFEVYG